MTSRTDRPSGEPAAFLGWRVAGAATLSQAVAIGLVMGTFGVFLQPMEQAFGASRAAVALGLAGLNLGTNLVMPIVGAAMDRGSIRRIMMLGVVLNAGALLWIARAERLWEVLAAYTLLASLGTAMFGPLASSTLVANWFDEMRGRALGLVHTGAPIGLALAAPLASWGVAALGWRTTMVVFAGLTLALALPTVALLVVSRPAEVDQAPDGLPSASRAEDAPSVTPSSRSVPDTRRLLRQRPFHGIAWSCGIPIAVSIAFTSHLVAFATGQGVDVQSASLLLSLQAGSGIFGTLLFGWLADRLPARPVLLASILTQALLLGLLSTGPGYGPIAGSVALLGACFGGVLPICGSMIGARYGPAAFGRVLGLVFLVSLPLAVAGPPAIGAIHDATGSYRPAFLALVALFGAAALALALLPRRADPSSGT